jgi:hypothetical protein
LNKQRPLRQLVATEQFWVETVEQTLREHPVHFLKAPFFGDCFRDWLGQDVASTNESLRVLGVLKCSFVEQLCKALVAPGFSSDCEGFVEVDHEEHVALEQLISVQLFQLGGKSRVLRHSEDPVIENF